MVARSVKRRTERLTSQSVAGIEGDAFPTDRLQRLWNPGCRRWGCCRLVTLSCRKRHRMHSIYLLRHPCLPCPTYCFGSDNFRKSAFAFRARLSSNVTIPSFRTKVVSIGHMIWDQRVRLRLCRADVRESSNAEVTISVASFDRQELLRKTTLTLLVRRGMCSERKTDVRYFSQKGQDLERDNL